MNKIKLFIFPAVLAVVWLLMTGQPFNITAAGSDNVEGFEENEYLPGLDIWINQTASPVQQYAPYQDNQDNQLMQSWKLQRYVLLPDSVDLSTWEIWDDDVIYVVGGFGGPAIHDDDSKSIYDTIKDLIKSPFITASAASEEKTETGITSFTGRAVDGVTDVDANARTGEDDISTVDSSYDHFNTTSKVSDIKANYTVPENPIDSGIAYDAGDSKSVSEYADEIADAEGQSVNSIQNATMIGYAFDSFGDLQAVTWNMDEETVQAPGQKNGFKLRRARIWMKAKKRVSRTRNRFIQKTVVSRIVDVNVFKKIIIAPSTLTGRPSRAKYFMSKVIPSAHHSVTKISSSALTKTKLRRVGAILGIVVLIGVVVLAIWYFNNNRRR